METKFYQNINNKPKRFNTKINAHIKEKGFNPDSNPQLSGCDIDLNISVNENVQKHQDTE